MKEWAKGRFFENRPEHLCCDILRHVPSLPSLMTFLVRPKNYNLEEIINWSDEWAENPRKQETYRDKKSSYIFGLFECNLEKELLHFSVRLDSFID